MNREGQTRSRAHDAGTLLFAFSVPTSALAIGSLIPSVLILVTIVAALSCALLWVDPPRRVGAGTKWILIGIAIASAATAVQSVPLPSSIAATVSPATADIWARALTPLREHGPRTHPITLAPAATHIELVRALLYGCIMLAALRIAARDRGSKLLEAVVVASASVVAIVTLAHAAVHAESVFGVYRPREVLGYVTGRIGPLLNPNHVSAYVNMGAFVAAGVALTTRQAVRRVAALAAAVLLAATSVWVSSRGGTGTLAVGCVMIIALHFGHRRAHRRAHARVELAAAVAALLVAAALIGLSTSEVSRGDLASADTSKLLIAQDAFHLLSWGAPLGVGRGAFESVFPSVHPSTAYFTFIKPENIIAQWTTEWGVPVAVAAFGAFALALRSPIGAHGDRFGPGAWVATVGCVLHDLVDFHLEVPGVAVLACVCLAIVGGRDDSRRRTTQPLAVRRVAFALSTAALASVFLVLPDVDHTLSDDRDAIASKAVDPSVLDATFKAELRSAMLRHPAEPFLPLAGAVHAQREDESVVPWVARALERFPTFGRAHLVLARSLARRHRAQARLEYRLAYSADRNLRPTIGKEAAYVVDDVTSALELVIDGDGGTDMLDALASSLHQRLPATAVQVDRELTVRAPTADGPLRRRVQSVLDDVAHGHIWCEDRAACTADGLAAARTLVERHRSSCAEHELLARVRIASGNVAEALDALAASLDEMTETAMCLRVLVNLSLEVGDRARADGALDRATRSGCGTREDCIDLYAWAARAHIAQGHLATAVGLFKRAAELSPEDRYIIELAETAERAGLLGETLDAFRKLAERHPDDPRWRRRAEAARAKAQHDRLNVTP